MRYKERINKDSSRGQIGLLIGYRNEESDNPSYFQHIPSKKTELISRELTSSITQVKLAQKGIQMV